MKNVIEEKLYLTENSKELFEKIDFSDTFSTTNHVNNLNEISNIIFNTTPKWIAGLFKIRNSIGKLIRLKSTKPTDYNTDYKVGGYVSFFKIFYISDDEIILGANDNHLNFRAVINNTKTEINNIKVTTLVEYNNIKGKIYMALIKPFHRLVIMKMVSQAFKNNI